MHLSNTYPATMAELRLLERLHYDAWPALEVADVQGLKLRFSGGGSRRANSVSSAWCEPGRRVDYDAAFARIECDYAERSAEPIVQSFDAGPLADLQDELQRRGYRAIDSTITMVKRIASSSNVDRNGLGEPSPEWLEVYLGAITENRRLVNEQIIRAMTTRRRFFGHAHDGRLISTALGVAAGDMAVIECVATRADARRLGGAAHVLSSLEEWAAEEGATLLGLQVVADNEPALALYSRLGFRHADRNRYWMRR